MTGVGDDPVSDEPIRVVLVEDHVLVLEALQTALEARGCCEVVAAVPDLAGARAALASARAVDVVVSDLVLPDGHGTDLVDDVADRHGAAVLILTGTDPREAVARALEAGCAGLIAKTEPMQNLADAVVAVHRGAAVFPAGLLRSLSRSPADTFGADLSAREREVLALLAQACTAREIADRLYVSLHTARNHIKSILGKLHARSQLEAVVLAHRHGLVDIGDLGGTSRPPGTGG